MVWGIQDVLWSSSSEQSFLFTAVFGLFSIGLIYSAFNNTGVKKAGSFDSVFNKVSPQEEMTNKDMFPFPADTDDFSYAHSQKDLVCFHQRERNFGRIYESAEAFPNQLESTDFEDEYGWFVVLDSH